MIEKLKALHPIIISLGTILGMIGLGLGATHRWHVPLISIGGSLGTIGGVLARMWQDPSKAASAPEVKS